MTTSFYLACPRERMLLLLYGSTVDMRLFYEEHRIRPWDGKEDLFPDRVRYYLRPCGFLLSSAPGLNCEAHDPIWTVYQWLRDRSGPCFLVADELAETSYVWLDEFHEQEDGVVVRAGPRDSVYALGSIVDEEVKGDSVRDAIMKAMIAPIPPPPPPPTFWGWLTGVSR